MIWWGQMKNFNSSNIINAIFSRKQEHCEINNSMFTLPWMWKEQNNQKGACIFEIMSFIAGLETSANMTAHEGTRARACKNLKFSPAHSLAWDSEHLSQMRPGNQEDLLLELIFWTQKSWIIPKLAAEVWRIWKGTRRAEKSAQTPQREGNRESWRMARGQPETYGGRGSQNCSERKVQGKAWWEGVLPKRSRADSLPLFKRENCLFYQNGRTLILGSSLPPHVPQPLSSPDKACLVLEEKKVELELLTFILNAFGCA